jgi:uncharacterized membrane protein
MTRQEYIAALKRALRSIPESEVTDICGDFEEHFAIGLASGKTEHEISAELGDPSTVAQTYLFDDVDETSRVGSNMKTTTQTQTQKTTEKDMTGPRLFVILFNIFVAVWIGFTIVSMILSFWGISIALLIGGITSFAGMIAASGDMDAFLALLGISLIAFAIVSSIINYFICKWTVIGTKAYIAWNKKIYNEGF